MATTDLSIRCDCPQRRGRRSVTDGSRTAQHHGQHRPLRTGDQSGV